MSTLTNAPRATTTAPAPRRRTKGRAVWEENPTWFGRFGKSSVIGVTLAVFIVPVWAVVITSFSTKASINAAGGGLVLVPHGLSLAN